MGVLRVKYIAIYELIGKKRKLISKTPITRASPPAPAECKE